MSSFIASPFYRIGAPVGNGDDPPTAVAEP
jgi:hypothetical protein